MALYLLDPFKFTGTLLTLHNISVILHVVSFFICAFYLEIVSDLRKNDADGVENSHRVRTQFPC